MKELFNRDEHPINLIGTRHGEKLYEVLCSREEMVTAIDEGDYFRLPPDFRDLNYSQFYERMDFRQLLEDNDLINTCFCISSKIR